MSSDIERHSNWPQGNSSSLSPTSLYAFLRTLSAW
jgi:hypothetical protein